MNWLESVDGYCERIGPAYWAEPLNALTNIAFLVAAWVMWRRVGQDATGRAMSVVLAVIGVGSYLFHTHANRLTGVTDVVPILAFILLYVFVASRDFLRLPPWAAAVAVLAFIPYAIVLTSVFARLPGFSVSAFYWPVPLLIALYAALLWRRDPGTAGGMVIGAALLCLSLTMRSLDGPLCETLPMGTHFLWHLMNALMLGWMIEVWRRWREKTL